MKTESTASATAIDRENPWPGLATFTEEQAGLFYGRDAEIRDLTKRAERNPLTVLFGQSGLGKSSLLQAGVFPRLRANSYWPIYVRLEHGPGAPSPTEQIKGLVAADTARAGTWTKPGTAKAGESLWEFFHHRDDRLVSTTGRTIVPVLVFDQFEELFTLGAGGGAERARAVAFMEELAELVENRPSEKLVARLEESSAEMEVFDFSRTDYRVVITLREDYLPHLESLKTTMPALMENRMRLARMTGTQALEAVIKPGGVLVSEEVARAIVEFVAGAKGGSVERLAELDVEPPLLSVICRELNERRRTLGQAQISADLVSGNRREILTDFYERSVADLPEGMRTFVEDRLLTKSGFRDNLALETALEEPGVTQALIDTLVTRRLLRIEDRMGLQRVELTHDVLAEVIRASRDARQQRIATEQLHARERVTRRRMWLARTIAAGLLVGLTGVSWVAWRAIRAEREQTRLRADAERLRVEAVAQELAAQRIACASDMNGVQHALATENLGRARELLNRHRPEPGGADLRGWEWRYLWQFCRSDAQAVLKESDDNSVISLSASADGKWLAVGGMLGGRLTLINLATSEKLVVPAGAGNVRVAFSPREPLLAIGTDPVERGFSSSGSEAASTGSRILLWNPVTRQVVREIALAGYLGGLSFSADGQSLAVGQTTGSNITGNEISVWRVADGTKLTGWPGAVFGGAVNSTFSTTPDLALATATLSDRSYGVIDLKTGQRRRVFSPETSAGLLALSPDGKILATSPGSMEVESTIQLLEVASGREIGRLVGHRGRVGQVVFLPDGKQLVSSSADQTLRLWDLATMTSVRTFRGHKTEVWKVILLPDQRTLVSGSKDGAVLRWDLRGEREGSATGVVGQGTSNAWTFAAGGNALVGVDRAGRVTRRQGRVYQDEERLFEIGPIAAGTVFDLKRPQLAVRTGDKRLQVWDWERRVLVREWGGAEESQAPQPQRFSNDGLALAVRLPTAPDIFSYREWEIASGREIRSHDFSLPPNVRVSGAYAPDGTTLAALPYPSGEARLLDLRAGGAKPLRLNVLEPGNAGFSADGARLVVPSLRSTLRIFDLAANREVAVMGGYMFGVHSAAFSPDGSRVVSGGSGVEAVALWDARSHERLLTLPAKVGSFASVAFSPDGSVLIGQTGGAGIAIGALHFWRAPSWVEIEQAEAAEGGVAAREKP